MLTIQGWLRWTVVRRLFPASGSVLEIGCGQGGLGAILSRNRRYVGLEPDGHSFAVARSHLGARVRQISDTQLEPATFDVVCAFEVLEHLDDDEAALRRWAERINPGGCLIVSVPAHRHLFGATDERVGHFRRYDPDDLQRLLNVAGFSDVDIRSYGFPVGYLLLWAGRLVARRTKGLASMEERTASSGRWLQPSRRSAFVRRVAALPFTVVQRPFERTGLGTGLVARARYGNRVNVA